MKAIIYFILCVLQPICLPVPEVATIAYGSMELGSMLATLIGISGTICGITIMYKASSHIGKRLRTKLKLSKKLDEYYHYVGNDKIKNNAELITGLMLVIPVLPDEIVCMGSALIGISYRRMLLISLIFKSISISMIAYSDKIAGVFGTSQLFIVAAEIVIAVLLGQYFKLCNRHEMKMEVQHADEGPLSIR